MISDVIFEYENILLGKKRGFGSTYFDLTEDQNEQTALMVIHHAIDSYLCWTQKQVEECFDWEIINRMRLNSLMKHIRFPVESDKEKDLFILIDKLYPKRNKSALKDPTLAIYNKILSGERSKFPKGYFDGVEGMFRALLCFQHMISLMEPFESADDIYDHFAHGKGIVTLKKYKLNVVSNSLYETPVDYLHAALPKEHRDEFLYHMHKFNLTYKRFLADKRIAQH